MSVSMLSLLNPKGMSFSNSGQSVRSSIGPSEVTGALSYMNLTEPYYHFALAKYCHCHSSFKILLDYFSDKIQQDITANKWQDAPGRARELALIPLYETLLAKPCSHCSGKVVQFNRNHLSGAEYSICGKCRGTGITSISAREQEKITGISKTSWSRTWRCRIDIYVKEILTRESEISDQLKKQLYSL